MTEDLEGLGTRWGADPYVDLINDLGRETDISEARVVDFSLYAESEDAAGQVAAIAQARGFRTTIERRPKRNGPDLWLVTASHSAVVSVAYFRAEESAWRDSIAGVAGASWGGFAIVSGLQAPEA